MTLSPDSIILWEWGPIHINATLAYTWLVMALLVIGSWIATRNLSSEPPMSTWQTALEALVALTRSQIADIMRQKPDPFLPFIGTLFLFIAVANLLVIVPGYRAPTGSLSTTAALATAVFFAVPVFGIQRLGLRRYLSQYIQPTVFMLPFHVISELSRTLGLAVRLFGNVMSGDLLVAILLAIVPLFFPVVMQLLGLLIGQIQAYIFAVLTAVFIASAIQNNGRRLDKEDERIRPAGKEHQRG
jgi:F-type H+-transporting ATPase subunit a